MAMVQGRDLLMIDTNLHFFVHNLVFLFSRFFFPFFFFFLSFCYIRIYIDTSALHVTHNSSASSCSITDRPRYCTYMCP